VSDIRVGDLVMVVKPMPCCGHTTPMQGNVFVVTGLFDHSNGYTCDYCDAPAEGMTAAGGESEVDLLRLKRFKPLDELERDQIVKELSV
jgi:hypothetical protein